MSERSVLDLFDLSGKVALVTGASGHLGKAMSVALAELGASIVVGSRDRQRAEATACDLPRVNGQDHSGVALDYRDDQSVRQGFAEAVGISGRVDILVNNGHDPDARDWRDVEAEQFTQMMVNATGYFLLSRELRDHVVQRNVAGSIVMIGSMYGSVGSYPEAYEGICSASPVHYQTLKGGIIQMTRHLAVYWAEDRVRVNCLSPGPFPSTRAPEALVERLKTKSPMKRMGQPHELKGAIALLASDASSYMTGQNLQVDGGWTAW